MLTGRRYRVAFTAEQAALAEETGAACRAVWNTALEQRREYRRRNAWVGYQQQARELAEAKVEHEWLKRSPSHCLQQALMDLDRACRERGTFAVRWRSSRRWSPSFRVPDPKQITVERLGRRWGRVKLAKLGWVLFRWSRALGGTVRSATVSRDGNRWYVSFLVEDGQVSPDQHACVSVVGVDRGVAVAVAVAVACSDGGMYDRAFTTPGERKRYRKLQQNSRARRRLARTANERWLRCVC
ncbi:transposase [Nocardia vinacea]|uniref:RNA-guided endonuclease InsQ/TnpB family protein n=1 Tax=Nocardia vinacea TaxID=96468 RepID=UPI0034078BC0